MDTEAITIYVICDEVFKALNVKDDSQAIMTNAEVVSFCIIAAQMFGGNHKRARCICKHLHYFPNILSESRLNRRVHKIPWNIWMAIFRCLALIFVKDNKTKEFSVDSFPVPCCKKTRIDKRHIFLGKKYIGYAPSEKKYFCGIKVHMIVTRTGQPVEVSFRHASESDVNVLWKMELELPVQSKLYADGAYNCYDLEDILLEDESIQLLAKRNHPNSKRRRTRSNEKEISSRRQIVETAFSCITGLFPRYIRARTENGFVVRIMSTILAYSMSFLV